MKITSAKTLITTFSPIRSTKEHANYIFKHDSLETKTNQLLYDDGLKRKNDCVPDKNVLLNNSVESSVNKSVNKTAKISFGGFFNASKIYKSDFLRKGLEFASDNGALFAAGVALFITTILRPMTIFATPGVKKENKECASAESIASGVMGFAIMAIISKPISKAIKKIDANPEKYLKKETIQKLKDGKNLVSSKSYKAATQLFKLGADFISAIPKAVLTCALIPPIISLIFSKQCLSNKQNIPPSSIYFKSNKLYQTFEGFIKEGQK